MSKRILYIYTSYSSFVKADDEILSEQNNVSKYLFKSSKGIINTAKELFKQFFYLLFSIWKFDIVYIWFADSHTFFPVLFSLIFKKPSFIVIGGFDAVSLPDLNYGLFASGSIRRYLGVTSIKYASYILPVDDSLIENTNYYATPLKKGLPVGIKNFVNGINGKIITIPTGYEPSFWQKQASVKRENSCVTVAFINDWRRWELKGGDLLLELAMKLPEYDFSIYGVSNSFMIELTNKLAIPTNLILFNEVKTDDLPLIYSKHKIYAQFSLSEGLPNVMCEAILCGCIPIGSNVNGIKSLILDSQFLLTTKNINKAAKIVNKAMEYSNEKMFINYQYVLKTFTIDKRKNTLYSLIQS